MADQANSEDDGGMYVGDAAYAIGEKMIEMADRVTQAAMFAPGAIGAWCFDMDGKTFDVKLSLRQPTGEADG